MRRIPETVDGYLTYATAIMYLITAGLIALPPAGGVEFWPVLCWILVTGLLLALPIPLSAMSRFVRDDGRVRQWTWIPGLVSLALGVWVIYFA